LPASAVKKSKGGDGGNFDQREVIWPPFEGKKKEGTVLFIKGGKKALVREGERSLPYGRDLPQSSLRKNGRHYVFEDNKAGKETKGLSFFEGPSLVLHMRRRKLTRRSAWSGVTGGSLGKRSEGNRFRLLRNTLIWWNQRKTNATGYDVKERKKGKAETAYDRTLGGKAPARCHTRGKKSRQLREAKMRKELTERRATAQEGTQEKGSVKRKKKRPPPPKSHPKKTNPTLKNNTPKKAIS